MKRILLMMFTVLLLATVTFTCLRQHSPEIQVELQQRASQLLEKRGFNWAETTVSGRDIALTGTAPDSSSRTAAEALLGELQGVRRINNQLAVAADAAEIADLTPSEATAAGAAPFMQIDFDGSHIALSGSIADLASKTALLQKAQALVGATNLVDDMQVQPEVPGDWAGIIATGVLDQLQAHEHVSARLETDALYFQGYAASADIRESARSAIAAALPQAYRLDYLVEAPTQPASSVPDTNSTGVAVAASCQTQLEQRLQRGGITFETASERISATSAALIKDLAAIIKTCPDVKIEIGGHTDSRGRAEANKKLSQLRAEAVHKTLVATGVPAAQLSAVGYGASQPVAVETSDAARERNRRIEFRIVE